MELGAFPAGGLNPLGALALGEGPVDQMRTRLVAVHASRLEWHHHHGRTYTGHPESKVFIRSHEDK